MFEFLVTIPMWVVGLGLGIIWGAVAKMRAGKAPLKDPGTGGFFGVFFDIAATAIFSPDFFGSIISICFGIAFLIALPFSCHDPMGARVVPALLSLCVGYLIGIRVARKQ